MNLTRINNNIRIGQMIVPETDTIDLLFLGRTAAVFHDGERVGSLESSGQSVIPVIHNIRYKPFQLTWLKSMFARTKSYISVISLIPEAA